MSINLFSFGLWCPFLLPLHITSLILFLVWFTLLDLCFTFPPFLLLSSHFLFFNLHWFSPLIFLLLPMPTLFPSCTLYIHFFSFQCLFPFLRLLSSSLIFLHLLISLSHIFFPPLCSLWSSSSSSWGFWPPVKGHPNLVLCACPLIHIVMRLIPTSHPQCTCPHLPFSYPTLIFTGTRRRPLYPLCSPSPWVARSIPFHHTSNGPDALHAGRTQGPQHLHGEAYVGGYSASEWGKGGHAVLWADVTGTGAAGWGDAGGKESRGEGHTPAAQTG